MDIDLNYNINRGYEIIIKAESLEERAIVHLLSGLTDLRIERDHSIHESYNLTKEITIYGQHRKAVER